MRDVADLLWLTMLGCVVAGVGISTLLGYLFFRVYRGFK